MWALFALAQHPDIQSRLRAELKRIETDMPSADDLSAEHLPLLDAVVRETLRVHAAVTSTSRVAMKDDIIPVSEPYFDKYGNRCDGIRIRKGDVIYIPILAMNRSKDIWGEDAAEFKYVYSLDLMESLVLTCFLVQTDGTTFPQQPTRFQVYGVI